jgi:hypothetical protein
MAVSLADRFRAAEGADLDLLQPHPPAAVSPAHEATPPVAGVFSSTLDEYLARPGNIGDELRMIESARAACRHELRERLQVLECWKVGAGLEAPLIEDLIWHYRDTLGISGKREPAIATPTGTLDPFDEAERRN